MTNKTTNENHEQERANQTAESGLWYVPRLNKSPNVHRDSDYYNRFEEGIISINDIDGFVEKMIGLGLKGLWSRSTVITCPRADVFRTYNCNMG